MSKAPIEPLSKKDIDPELYKRLKAEAQSPFRSLRRFFYLAFAGSGFIGGVVFLAKLAAGKDLDTTIPNLALQAGVVALMLTLYRWDSKKAESKENSGSDG
jgi:Low psii accumulation1 / Rep27